MIKLVISKMRPVLPAIYVLKILETTYGKIAVHMNWPITDLIITESDSLSLV